ncbi:MAG: hypothetical protein NUK63_04385 [Candidatus Bathyarchaeum tardum]|nr:MAG: hypothetical protein NUK63_04385 [Candidatus Bathyarchaeum tardum]
MFEQQRFGKSMEVVVFLVYSYWMTTTPLKSALKPVWTVEHDFA